MKTILSLLAVLILAVAAPVWADTAMLQLAMPDAQVIAGANVDGVKNSPLGETLLARMSGKDEQLAKFIQVTGFDPRRDLREVMVASRNTSGKSGAVMVARGTFDEAKILGLAAAHGAMLAPYQGINIFTDGKGKDGAGAFAGGYLIAGEVAEVKGAIDRLRAAGTAPLSELALKAQEAAGRYDVWAVTTAGPDKFAGRVSSNPDVQAPFKGEALQSITRMSGGVRFGANVEIGGEAETRTAQDAASLADVYKFLAQMVAMNGPRAGANPLQMLVKSSQVTASGNTVRFSASIPNAELEKLLGARGRRVALNK